MRTLIGRALLWFSRAAQDHEERQSPHLGGRPRRPPTASAPLAPSTHDPAGACRRVVDLAVEQALAEERARVEAENVAKALAHEADKLRHESDRLRIEIIFGPVPHNVLAQARRRLAQVRQPPSPEPSGPASMPGGPS